MPRLQVAGSRRQHDCSGGRTGETGIGVGCVRLWGSVISPEEVILRILSEALERAVRRIRELGLAHDVDSFSLRGLSTRMGCPVSAGLDMRRVLAEVARRIGFPAFRTGD